MKLWLTGITNAGNGEHLKELIEPIKEYFDGMVWVFHTDNREPCKHDHDEGYKYLKNSLDTKVVLAPWCNRTDFSRNIGLYHGPIRYGDWFLTIDTLERMHVDFAAQIPELIQRFERTGIDGVYLRNKHFLFQFNEQTAYVHNPHSGVAGVKQSFEITSLPFWRDEYWINVRAEHRDPYEFVDHNLKYYLFPNTNHLVLKCESDREFILHRYQLRGIFLNELNRLGIDSQDFNAVKSYIERGDLSDTAKQCIAEEKYLNDVYRFYRLGRNDIVDDFDFDNLVKVI